MSYATFAAPVLPSVHIPVRAIQNAAVLAVQSLGVAATLWALLAAPGFLTDRTALRNTVPIVAAR